MTITELKGGSLSRTTLHEGLQTFVRKEVCSKTDREYGYVRWYSQLKKLQRYNTIFPGLFPKVLNVSHECDRVFFDIEYLNGYVDVKTLLSDKIHDNNMINTMHSRIWEALDTLHTRTFMSPPNISTLYFKEEVVQKLSDALSNTEFALFYNHKEFTYNGMSVSGIGDYMHYITEFFDKLNLSTEEYVHGNPTLENIMYSVTKDKIMFIDLYEESIIDTKYLDYSQILQCSNSYYGYINDRTVLINDQHVSHSLDIPTGFRQFNTLFMNELRIRHTNMKLVSILEATQFIRMLPFKCAVGDTDKAKFFYVHACYLLGKIFND